MARRVLSVLVVLALSGCGAVPSGGAGSDKVPDGTPDAATARAQLGQLAEGPAGGLDGYVRDCDDGAACVFGRPWSDVDGDGCDQRSQVLARDLVGVQRKEGRCGVTGGTLHDPYTGDTVRGVSKVQIDHVVPLAEMWRSGASGWTTEQRTAAANDLRNLIAVRGEVNQSKGDRTPAEWMPPNPAYSCAYARIYVGVKARYRLTVTPPEREALDRTLSACR
ncbi:HNH endonuclease family protein [Saccharothrix obliqua]|uniref:HNH endonuclease family protein n=1 Tax=Saccharothrix obliqua TaxID=2861747 RepID=UPI001C5D3063|nr:HNH endonuclease family protein [Saccharothrix obliqua]MBW4718373.1 HNH endonuclease family protein [Saccharothrix obliqua]